MYSRMFCKGIFCNDCRWTRWQICNVAYVAAFWLKLKYLSSGNMLEVIWLEGHTLAQEDAFISRDNHLLQVMPPTELSHIKCEYISSLLKISISFSINKYLGKLLIFSPQ